MWSAHVRVDHAGNGQTGLLGRGRVLVGVRGRIDDEGLARLRTADDVAQTAFRASLNLDDRQPVTGIDLNSVVDPAPALHPAVDGRHLVLVGRRLEARRKVARREPLRTDGDDAVGVTDDGLEVLESAVQFLLGTERKVERTRDVPGLVAVFGTGIDEREIGVLVLQLCEPFWRDCGDHTRPYGDEGCKY